MAFGINQPSMHLNAIEMAPINRAMGGPIAPAVATVQQAARAPDTQLAHITPDEAAFIDHLQGGRRVNPMTGLPEYGLFGSILKAVARVAGAIGGFMVAGPAGAALGSGAATKLTGGSWKDAAGAAALSGLGGWAGSGFGSLTSGGSTLANAAGNATSKLGVIGNVAKSGAGLGASVGALSAPLESRSSSAPTMPTGPGDTIHLNDVEPQPRTYNPYTGRPEDFATSGHMFYTPLDPIPKYRAPGAPIPNDALPLQFAGGGAVMGIGGMDLGPRAFRGGSTIGPGQPGGGIAGPSMPGIGGHTKELQQAAILGYQMVARGGAIQPEPRGPVRGPGGPEEDKIPAMLSNGEHVVDSRTVSLAGGGNNERGQKVIEKIKQDIRKGHVADPKKPPAFQRGAARAKKRAGMKGS